MGKTVLGYPERDVWHMTLRKIYLLYIEHLKETGKFREPATLDNLIPEE